MHQQKCGQITRIIETENWRLQIKNPKKADTVLLFVDIHFTNSTNVKTDLIYVLYFYIFLLKRFVKGEMEKTKV